MGVVLWMSGAALYLDPETGQMSHDLTADASCGQANCLCVFVCVFVCVCVGEREREKERERERDGECECLSMLVCVCVTVFACVHMCLPMFSDQCFLCIFIFLCIRTLQYHDIQCDR